MVVSMNFCIKGNSKWFPLINVVIFVFLVYIYHLTYNKSTFGNYIGKKNNDINILDTVLHRSLSKYGFNEERERRKLKERLTYDRDMKSPKTDRDELSTYKTFRKGELSQLELYKKDYKKRYGQKKGLKKLDCYWEKKIFDKIEQVNILAEKTKSRKKRFIKKILNKHTIYLFLFALLPTFGIIIPAIFSDEDQENHIINVFFGKCGRGTEYYKTCDNGLYHVPIKWAYAMFCINHIFTLVSIIAFTSIITYTAVKFIKYEFLKYGLGNVTFKKCFRICKNAF